MAKEEKNQTQPMRRMNKETRSKHEKDQKHLKWLKIGAGVIGALIILLILAGIFYEYQYKPNKVLGRVENDKITVTDYQEYVRYQRTNIISNYNYISQLYQMMGMPMDENTKAEYESQLSPAYAGILGQQAYTAMINNLVMKHAAMAMDITVSDDEIEAEMKNMWGYFPNGTPTPQPTAEPYVNTPTVSAEQIALLNYTPTPAATATGNALTSLTEQSGPEAPALTEAPVAAETLVPTETLEPTPQGEPTETLQPTPSLTPTTYTEEMYKQNVANQFEDNPYYSEAFFKQQVYYQLLEEKVKKSLEAGITRDADMVWARHILVATEEEAKAVIERLNNDEDWNVVAAEVSLDESNKNNGGDLGWFTKGSMVAPFETAAYEQEIGTYSQVPVKTDFGYHIIQIIGHEVRPLTSTQYQTAITTAYTEWIEEEKAKLKVTESDDWMEFVPTEPAFSTF